MIDAVRRAWVRRGVWLEVLSIAAVLATGALVARRVADRRGRAHESQRPPVCAFLGLGSNVGDRAYWLAAAIHRLEGAGVRIARRSRIYETPAWGKTDQPDFLNQVLEVETRLSPGALLERCQAVERALGRVRAERWGPRTIDVDLLLYDEIAVSRPGLVVPHPELHRRAFVLVPLLELRPHLKLPDGRALAPLLDTLPERGAITPLGNGTASDAVRPT
jgi:2-amino-4-hydroxy-6-hydroxymethyldihydropteridine diphosphokinase